MDSVYQFSAATFDLVQYHETAEGRAAILFKTPNNVNGTHSAGAVSIEDGEFAFSITPVLSEEAAEKCFRAICAAL